MADVYIAPSLEHFNVGYGNYGTEEKRANVIADVVELVLNANGVTTDRNSPEMSLVEAVADANAKNPRIYLSIQTRSADGTLRGAEVFYYRPNTNGQRLASDVFDELSKVTPTEDIGISDGSLVFGGLGYYELRKTRAPATIVKVGFHDNPLDADFIINNTYEIGVAIAKGVLNYLGLPFTEPAGVIKENYNGL